MYAGQDSTYLLECRTIARPMELIQSSLSCIERCHSSLRLLMLMSMIGHDMLTIAGRTLAVKLLQQMSAHSKRKPPYVA